MAKLMGVHDLKKQLLEGPLPGVSGLIMQYEPGTGREIFTVTVDGKNVAVAVDPNTKQDDVIAAIVRRVKDAFPVEKQEEPE